MNGTRRTIRTLTGYWELRDDGIAVMHVDDGAEDTLETAVVDVAKLEELVGDRAPVPIMIHYNGLKKQSFEARRHYTESAAAKRSASRVALIIESKVSRVIGNIYIGVGRPPQPTRLFTSEQSAVDWLLQA